MSSSRRPLYINPSPKPLPCTDADAANIKLASNFHQQLPGYAPTRLAPLEPIATKIGVKAVYLKDESDRLGLPSFKILGASWGTFRAVTQHLGLSYSEVTIDEVKKELKSRPVTLFAATDGNHGRAIARMGSVLGVPTEIHVPAGMAAHTIELIQSEGASVVASEGTYDAAMREAQKAAAKNDGILIQDCAFDSYKEIPQWMVEGYQTMLNEIDTQIPHGQPDLVIVPVGVGSFAHGVVSHYKREEQHTRVLTVEADTAACLYKSLTKGQPIVENTTPTIMTGLDCGAVSTTAWPALKDAVDGSCTVSDHEAHVARMALQEMGIEAGPCGASPLAALERLTAEDKQRLGLNADSTVVLLCTEGSRPYDTPMSVAQDDAISLTQALVQIDSSSPALGSIPGPGEKAIAHFVRAWLEHRGIENHWTEPTPGRPSIVGVVKGSGGGKSLMLNGHLDTVTILGYEDDALSGKMEDGKIYGRGAQDMKAGVAAALIALCTAKDLGLRGDVIFTGVADEEANSLGTEDVLRAGWRADAAIVNEPTDEHIVNAHKGFVWLEVDIHGKAAHGSRPETGVDAIVKAGHLLVEIGRYGEELSRRQHDVAVGPPSVHASLIKGGEEASSYPALCTVTIERRTISGETTEQVEHEVQNIIARLAEQVPDFKADLKVTFQRPAYELPRNHDFVSLMTGVVKRQLSEENTTGEVVEPVIRGETFWTDCALLAEQGIPAVLWGPKGEGLHEKKEWVEAKSVETVARGLVSVAKEFCR